MSIKQTGGVFGRNPTFNNLTLDGDFNITGGMTVDTDALVVDKTTNRVGVNITTPLVSLESRTAGNGAPSSSGTAQPNAAIRVSSPATSGVLDFGVNGGAPWIQATDRTDLSQLYTVSLNPNGGNVSVGDGNLVIGTSGKGIDFSVTSGSGTSELFSDYEEGAWTPANDSMTVNSGTFAATGTYVKIGKLVFIDVIQTSGTVSAASGAGMISGFPFTPARTSTMNYSNSVRTLVGVGIAETNSKFYGGTAFSNQTALRFSSVYTV